MHNPRQSCTSPCLLALGWWRTSIPPFDSAAPVGLLVLQVIGRDSAVGRCPANKLTGHIGCDNKSVNMGSGSRWVLERAVPGTNLYRIRMQASRAAQHREAASESQRHRPAPRRVYA